MSVCGFAGYLNLSEKPFIDDTSLLQAMQQELVHRGPDGSGVWSSCDHDLALVHRRLSIIDLSEAGAQPMIDQDQTVIIEGWQEM